jgi:membrane-associated phospholipid phosphatase
VTRELRSIVLGVCGILLVIAAGLLVRGLAGGRPLGPDEAWNTLLAAHRGPAAVGIAQAMAWIGGSGAWISTWSVAAIAVVLRRWRLAIALLVAAELGSIASSAIKTLVGRPRPSGAIDALSSYAFPSGHTTWAAAVAASLAVALPRVWMWLFAAAWIAFMAWSRTYLGVHWLTDVAAGALLGISAALLAAGLVGLLAPGHRTIRSRSVAAESVEADDAAVVAPE